MKSSKKVRGIVFNRYYDVHNKTTRFSIAIPSMQTAVEFTVHGEIPFKGAEDVSFEYYLDKSGNICLDSINDINYSTVSDQKEEKTKANFQFQFGKEENKASEKTQEVSQKSQVENTSEFNVVEVSLEKKEKISVVDKISDAISNTNQFWREQIPFYKDGILSKFTNKKYSKDEISEIIRVIQNSNLPATRKVEYQSYIRSKKVLKFSDLKNLEKQYLEERDKRVDKELEKASKS